jgi:deazaflavin-dependent oxidoreductase (nitroreductase family)
VAKTFHPTTGSRIANAVLSSMLRLGLGPGFIRLLTVTGRKSGQPRTTPVVPVQTDAGHWLVSPYGTVDWVLNARAAGRVTLWKGRLRETFAVTELEPDEAAPVLRAYLNMKAVRARVGPYFDVGPDASDEELAAESARHPVFALRPVPA